MPGSLLMAAWAARHAAGPAASLRVVDGRDHRWLLGTLGCRVELVIVATLTATGGLLALLGSRSSWPTDQQQHDSNTPPK
jgi:hypothetical protein